MKSNTPRTRRSKGAWPLLVGLTKANPDDKDGTSDMCLITVWCPYCKVYHQHGFEKNGPADRVSHRLAHCPDACGKLQVSPFRKGGYFIGIDTRLQRANTERATQ